MAAGVALDTSFLITLADPKRANHQAARQYWRLFAEQKIPMFLPTIAISEFCIKQEIPLEILRACIVLPFNYADALKAAGLDFRSANRAGESRDSLKDDVKIIAQAIVKEAEWLITDDGGSLYRFAKKLSEDGKSKVTP